jgi:glycosyltransferase involved in cell wall biosynthesis
VKVIKIIEEGRVGGPHMDILRVTPYVQKMDVSITVILPRNSNKFQKSLAEAGVPYQTSPLTTMRKHPKVLLFYAIQFIPELFYLVFLIRRLKTDIVHVCGGSWQIKGVIAGRLAGRKVIWHLNDNQSPKILKLVFRMLQPLAHAFITAGSQVREYYLPREIKRPIFNISAPVDCSVFDPNIFKKKLPEDVLRIITVANINPIKGLEIFLEMAAILNQKVVKLIEFRIVGPVYDSQRKYFETLKVLVKKLKINNLIFVGEVENTGKEFADADIYVCTSISEASPTSIWEAMSMGKPVVTTNVGEVSYIIENGVSGLICENHEPQELAENIEYFINNKKIMEKLGKHARSRALEILDVPEISRQHFNAYQNLI